MKKLLATAAILTAVAAPMAAQARVDVGIGINLGPPVVYGGYREYVPPPIYYTPAPVYYEAPRVYYRGYYRDRAWCPDDDRGYYRRGWHHEGWHDRDHDRWDRR